jgi:hypothetical protein
LPVAGYEISTDATRLDRDLVHDFLSKDAYWARGIPRAVVDRCIENSLCFGLYRDTEQVGFARVVTDRAAIAYLGDVFNSRTPWAWPRQVARGDGDGAP